METTPEQYKDTLEKYPNEVIAVVQAASDLLDNNDETHFMALGQALEKLFACTMSAS